MKYFSLSFFIYFSVVPLSSTAIYIGSGVMIDQSSNPFSTRNKLRTSALIALSTTGIFASYRGVKSTSHSAISGNPARVVMRNFGLLLLSMSALAGGEPVNDRIDNSHMSACTLIMGQYQSDDIDFSKQDAVTKWLNNKKDHFTTLFDNLLLKSQFKINSGTTKNSPDIFLDNDDLIYQISIDKNGQLAPQKMNNSEINLLENKNNYLAIDRDSNIIFLSVSGGLNFSACSY